MLDEFFGRLKWIETGALALGILTLVGASQLGWAWLYTVCMLAFGLGFCLSGLGALSTRRVRVLEFFRDGNPYLGPAALPWGFVTFLAGLALFGFGLLRAAGLDTRLFAYLGMHPAPVLAFAGLTLSGIGAGMLLGPPDWNATFWRALLHLPLRALGLLLAVAGLICLGLAAFDAASPGAFDAWLRSMFSPFTS
ncbi:MAG: hypothetical protein P8X64_11515 [Anaerolineales bacterium]|jgi:hypothetical protein